MPAFAIVEGGVVVNVIEADAEYAASIGAIDATGGGIGWAWDGEAFTAPEPAPAPVPASVSPRQIRQALTAAGLRASVEAAVAASDQDTKDWYEFSTAFERAHPAVIAMGIALGVSSDALDGLWIAAGAL